MSTRWMWANKEDVIRRAAVLALLVGACSAPHIAEPPAEPLTFSIDRDVPYTSELSVDIYYPDAEGPWPVAVVLHGGEEHKANISGFGLAAAQRGIVTFVPDWHAFWAEIQEDRLAAVEDVDCAIRFARERAAEYGGDAERVVMAGWSAGANFAAIAVLRDDSVVGDCLVDSEVGNRTHGLVGLDGVYNFAELIADEPISWTREEIDEISAHSYVPATAGDDQPEFRLFTGSVEELHTQAEQFRDDLAEAGFQVTLVRDPSLSHAAVMSAPGAVDALVELAFP